MTKSVDRLENNADTKTEWYSTEDQEFRAGLRVSECVDNEKNLIKAEIEEDMDMQADVNNMVSFGKFSQISSLFFRGLNSDGVAIGVVFIRNWREVSNIRYEHWIEQREREMIDELYRD